jgi:hypothetical protein
LILKEDYFAIAFGSSNKKTLLVGRVSLIEINS